MVRGFAVDPARDRSASAAAWSTPPSTPPRRAGRGG